MMDILYNLHPLGKMLFSTILNHWDLKTNSKWIRIFLSISWKFKVKIFCFSVQWEVTSSKKYL